MEIACGECREVVLRLIEATPTIVQRPAKHGRPAVFVDWENLSAQLYTMMALLNHLEDQDHWREHLARADNSLAAAVTTLRGHPDIHRAIEPVARLNSVPARTIRRRIVEHFENRGAWLYLVARPPAQPVEYSVGNVFWPRR